MRNYFTLLFVLICCQVFAQFGEAKALGGTSTWDCIDLVDMNNDGLVDVIKRQHLFGSNSRTIIQMCKQEITGEFLNCHTLLIEPTADTSASLATYYDFNEDGYKDLVLTRPGLLSIYENVLGQTLDLKFESEVYDNTSCFESCEPWTTRIEDFDEDGDMDVFVNLYDELRVFFGSPENWEFSEPTSFLFNGYTTLIDYNFDGHIDGIWFDEEDILQGMIGNGQGSFEVDPNVAMLVYSGAASKLDVNNDLLLDAVYYLSDVLHYYRNLGDGNFEFVEIPTEDPILLRRIIDVDSDGDLDFIYNTENSFPYQTFLALNNNDTFENIEIEWPSFDHVKILDINGDGFKDLFFEDFSWEEELQGAVYTCDSNDWSWNYSAHVPSIHAFCGLHYYEDTNLLTMNMKHSPHGETYRDIEYVDGYMTSFAKEKFTDNWVPWMSIFRDLNNDGEDDFIFIELDEEENEHLKLAIRSIDTWEITELSIANQHLLSNSIAGDPFYEYNNDGLPDFMVVADDVCIVFVNDGNGGFMDVATSQLMNETAEVMRVDETTMLLRSDTTAGYLFHELLQNGTWMNHWSDIEIPSGYDIYLFVADYDFDGNWDVFSRGYNGSCFISNAFINPILVWIEPFGMEYDFFRSPFVLNNNWCFISNTFNSNPIVDLITGEIIFETPTNGYNLKCGDLDGDLDLDLIFDVGIENEVYWCENWSNVSSQFNIIVFEDANGNALFDDNEIIVDVGDIVVNSNGSHFLVDSGGGNYFCYAEASQIQISHVANTNIWQHTTDNQIAVSLSGTDFTIYFGLQPIGQVQQCEVSSSLSNGTCNTESILYVNVINTGNMTANCQVKLAIPNIFSFVSASTPPAVSGNLYTFNAGLLTVGESTQIQVHLLNPSEQFITDEYTFASHAFTIENNIPMSQGTTYYNGIVSCAYDPNDKTELNTLFTNHLYQIGEGLEYQVRFQNTGNAPATNIHIVDQLSNNLDWNSFQLIDASHDYHYSLTSTGLLTVYFDNIMLADSFSNEIESHGYFKYAIQPVYTEEQGQIIYNTAFIYFDENPAVITNTTYSEISVLSLYETDRVLDGVVIFPNPNSGNFNITTQEKGHWDLAIYDVYGKLVETSFFPGDNHHMTSPIGDGIYLLQLHNKSNGKLLTTKFVMGH